MSVSQVSKASLITDLTQLPDERTVNYLVVPSKTAGAKVISTRTAVLDMTWVVTYLA